MKTQKMSAGTSRPKASIAQNRIAPTPIKNTHGLAEAFHQEMLDLYGEALRRCGYQPRQFLRMVVENGGLQAVKMLLAKPEVSSAFGALWMLGARELTVEAFVVLPRWRPLFSNEEVACAESRLQAFAVKAA